MAIREGIKRAIYQWWWDAHHNFRLPPLPYNTSLPNVANPDNVTPDSSAEWETFQWNPPERIYLSSYYHYYVDGKYLTWTPDPADYVRQSDPRGYSYRYYTSTVPDQRPTVMPKPTWLELMAQVLRVSTPDEINPVFGMTREERHYAWQGVVARGVFGAKHHDNEHYIRERTTMSQDQKNYLAHARYRFHEVDISVQRIIEGLDVLRPEDVEPTCKWKIDDVRNLEGISWTPPWKDKPFSLHNQIPSFTDPTPDPVPKWDPIIRRTGVDGGRVFFVVEVPVPAVIGVTRLQAYRPNRSRFSTAFINKAPEQFGFYIELPSGDQEAEFRWTLRTNNTSGTKRFRVSTQQSSSGGYEDEDVGVY